MRAWTDPRPGKGVKRMVTMSAPDVITKLADEMLAGKVRISPKHAMMTDIESVEAGKVPEAGDPRRDAVLAEMAETRHGLGVGIWVENAYPCLVTPINLLCKDMQYPSTDTRKHLDYAIMHVAANLDASCNTYIGHKVGLEQPDELCDVTDETAKAMYWH